MKVAQRALLKLGIAGGFVVALALVANQFVRVSQRGAVDSEGIAWHYIASEGAAAAAPWLLGLLLSVWVILLLIGRGAPISGALVEQHQRQARPDSALTPQAGESVPEWLAEKAEDAPTMVRVLVETVGTRLRRARPKGLVDSHWNEFRIAGTVGGCVALALRLHVDVPKQMRTPLELAMRASLDLGCPGAETQYEHCTTFVRESLREVERAQRKGAIPVLIATWVCGVVVGQEAISEPETVRQLAELYDSETGGYWVSAGLE